MTHHSIVASIVVCLAALGLTACDQPTDPDVEFRDADPVANVPITAKPRAIGPVADIDALADPSTPPPPDPAVCQTLYNEAIALVARYATCRSDRDCHAFTTDELELTGACVPLFQCYVGLVDQPHLKRFTIEAQRLDDAYTDAGCPCPVAACSHPDYTASFCPADACTVETIDIDDLAANPQPDPTLPL